MDEIIKNHNVEDLVDIKKHIFRKGHQILIQT